MVKIAGKGETAGIVVNGSVRHSETRSIPNVEVKTTTLARFADDVFPHVKAFLYVVIDTEGHEPFVLSGMELGERRNQQRHRAGLPRRLLVGSVAARERAQRA